MQQYFVEEVLKIDDIVIFDHEQLHHLQNVLRMKEDHKVYVVDKTSSKFLVCLLKAEEKLVGKVMEKITKTSELPCFVSIAQGLIKGERWDYFLEKSVEFGASNIIPLILKRNVVKIDKDDPKKIERYNKILLSAAKQSKRDIIPTCLNPHDLKMLAKLDYDLKIIAYEDEAGREGLIGYLNKIKANDRVLLVVGSEGGFDDVEIAFLKQNDFVVCGLGPRILRAESAALYFLSALSLKKELEE